MKRKTSKGLNFSPSCRKVNIFSTSTSDLDRSLAINRGHQ